VKFSSELNVKLKLVYQKFLLYQVPFLKCKTADLAVICVNLNIDFQIPYTLSFLKCIGLLIPIKFKQKYIVNLTSR